MVYMDVIKVYSIVAGGVFGVLVVLHWILRVFQIIQTLSIWAFRHFVYPFLLMRRRFIGPWTRAGFLLRVLYVSLNVFCGSFRVTSLAQAGIRVGTLSLLNMVPLFFGLHLGFIADLLGLSLKDFSSIHGASAVMSTTLGVLHVILNGFSRQESNFHGRKQIYGLIVSTFEQYRTF